MSAPSSQPSAVAAPETPLSDMVKAQLILAAYTGAAAMFAGVKTINVGGQPLPVNPDAGFQDPGTRALAVAIFEEAKIQYQPILAAFQDKSGIFADPKVAPGSPLAGSGSPVAGVAAALATGNVASLGQQLLAALTPAAISALQGVLAGASGSVPAQPAVPSLTGS